MCVRWLRGAVTAALHAHFLLPSRVVCTRICVARTRACGCSNTRTAASTPQVRWAGDRCCVCDGDVDFDFDQLVCCEGCGITVHQSCYGVQELPEQDAMWLCRCVVCCGSGGMARCALAACARTRRGMHAAATCSSALAGVSGPRRAHQRQAACVTAH